MKRASARARVVQAEIKLAAAEAELEKSSRPLRARLRDHRAAVIVLGGLTSGLALSLLPIRWWGHIGATFAKIAAGVARSALTPALVGAAVAQVKNHPAAADAAAAE
jgi:hypothetical protein